MFIVAAIWEAAEAGVKEKPGNRHRVGRIWQVVTVCDSQVFAVEVETMLFDRDKLVEGLTEVGAAAMRAGKIIDLAVYGGSCLMLVSNFRDASQDVDAVATNDQAFVDRIATKVADRHGWPRSWLNDGVRTYLSPNVDMPDDHALIGTYPSEQTPGLRLYVPTAEYMLAMKLMAMRIDETQGERDKSDIENLVSVLGIKTKAALMDLAVRYYPEARVSAKLILAADRIVRDVGLRDERDAVARYLDRGGGSGVDQ